MSELENELLMRLANNEDIKSSDRAEDKARTRLKSRGLIFFDREKWRWHLTYAGQDAVYGSTQEEHSR